MKKFLLFVTMFFTSHLAHGAQVSQQTKNNLWDSIVNDSEYTPQDALTACIAEDNTFSFDAFVQTSCTDENDSMLHCIVEKGNLEHVYFIFEQISEETKNELVLKHNTDGNTALHLACINSSIKIAKYILTQITDTETKKTLIDARNNQNQTAREIANEREDAAGSELLALLQAEKQNIDPVFNFLLSNKPEHQQQRRRTGHGIALVATLVTAYDYFQYNKQKTKKQNTDQEKTEKNKPKSKKNLKQKSEQKEIIVTETKTGFKAYLKALYAKPMKHKKAFAGLIGALAAEYFALTQ